MPINMSSPPAEPSNIKLLATETLSGAASTFSSVTIPAGYNFIKICISALGTGAGSELGVRFNADAGNNYMHERLRCTSTTVAGSAHATVSYAYAGVFTSTTYEYTAEMIVNNSAALKKAYCTRGGQYNWVDVTAGLYNSATIISSLVVIATADISAGSKMSVYGYN